MNHTMQAPELAAIEIHGLTRSSFIMKSALAGAAVYGAASVGPMVSKALAQGGDVDILNYALTLEYLESEFYKAVFDGLSGDNKALGKQLGEDENAHVDALVTAVKGAGGKPVKKPTFAFPTLKGDAAILKVANTLEDTGVSAYNGAAPLISSKEILGAAGSIVQVEARHAALIRLARGVSPAPLAFDKASEMEDVIKAITPFIKS